MNSYKEITGLLIRKSEMNSELPSYGEYCEEVLDRLRQGENKVIGYIEQMTDERTLLELMTFFQDLSFYFQSKHFIETIEKLPARFPDLQETYKNLLLYDIDAAKKAMRTEEQQREHELQLAFERKMDNLIAQDEEQLLHSLDQIDDQRTLLALYGWLPDVTKRLKSRRLIEAMEQAISRVEDPREIGYILLQIQDARDELAHPND